nr:ribonuclease H-like domain-containing protein [Tanacetum cinerariifolium]
MYDEYNALGKNGTWLRVPRPAGVNMVCSMWLFKHKFHADGTLSRYKARLVTNGSSQQLGVDFDETFSPIVKPSTIHTVLSLAMSRKWLIHQLDVKNAFLNGDLFVTVYMHKPSGFVDARSTLGYCVFLGDNLLSCSAKRQHTLLRSSVEAEYRGVANVMAKAAWLRNLLRELHSPLSTATLVYCDNISAVYMSANPIQHQRMKHIEVDIHFVHDMVTVDQRREERRDKKNRLDHLKQDQTIVAGKTCDKVGGEGSVALIACWREGNDKEFMMMGEICRVLLGGGEGGEGDSLILTISSIFKVSSSMSFSKIFFSAILIASSSSKSSSAKGDVKGWKSFIEWNNVVPLRSDTIRLVQNGCPFYGIRSEDPNQHLKDFLKLMDSLDFDGENRERMRLRLFQFSLRDQAINWLERRTVKLRNDILMFQQHHGESLSEAWTRFKDLLQKVPHHGIDLWLQVQIFYDHVNPVIRRTIDQSTGGKLRERNAKESWALLEDLALYDNESLNYPRDFTKPVKEITLPQDVPSTFDRHLIELENQVQRLMKAHLALTQPTQVNKITTSCEICSGPHDTQYCMEDLKQDFVEYVSLRSDEAGGKWYTFKPEKNNFGDTYSPSWKSHPNLRWRQPKNFQNNFSNPPNRF